MERGSALVGEFNGVGLASALVGEFNEVGLGGTLIGGFMFASGMKVTVTESCKELAEPRRHVPIHVLTDTFKVPPWRSAPRSSGLCLEKRRNGRRVVLRE